MFVWRQINKLLHNNKSKSKTITALGKFPLAVPSVSSKSHKVALKRNTQTCLISGYDKKEGEANKLSYCVATVGSPNPSFSSQRQPPPSCSASSVLKSPPASCWTSETCSLCRQAELGEVGPCALWQTREIFACVQYHVFLFYIIIQAFQNDWKVNCVFSSKQRISRRVNNNNKLIICTNKRWPAVQGYTKGSFLLH